MFYGVFVFLLCPFIFPCSDTVRTKNKSFYISVYNTSNGTTIGMNTIKYEYEKSEVLSLSCHNKQKQPVIWLRWWHNELIIPGTEDKVGENNLIFNITEKNDKDRLTCYAFEDTTDLIKNEKRYENMAILILDYIGSKGITSQPTVLKDSEMPLDKEENEVLDHWFKKQSKSTLFWIGLAVAVVIIILATILVIAGKRSYRMRDDKIFLHPAVSSVSVSTTESRKPITAQIKTIEPNYYTNDTLTSHASREISSEYQEPMDSQTYCEPQMYSEPDKQIYTEPIPKILRKKKDNVYVNYNENNESANINNKNIDLYFNCDDELHYYSETR